MYLFKILPFYKAAWLTIAILISLPAVGGAQVNFSEFVEKLRVDGDALLYSECSSDSGKSLLIITLKPKSYDVWFFEIKDGWLIEGTHLLIKGNDFEFIDPPGGQITRARIRSFVEFLLEGQFGFLTPRQMDKLLSSMPNRKCPNFEPHNPENDLNR